MPLVTRHLSCQELRAYKAAVHSLPQGHGQRARMRSRASACRQQRMRSRRRRRRGRWLARRWCAPGSCRGRERSRGSRRRHTQSAACERARDARLHATDTRITPASLRGKRRHLKMRLQATLEFATCQSPPQLPTTKSICTATACHAREAETSQVSDTGKTPAVPR